MIYTYVDLKKRGLSNYKIKKAVENGYLIKIDKGVYSDKPETSELEILCRTYPHVIITLDSALYFYGLIKKEPKVIYVATKQKARKIIYKNIKQIYMSDHLLDIGVAKMNYKMIQMNIYSLERLLIEVVRNKTNIKYETYKEAIDSYSKISKLLNKKKLDEYLTHFKDSKIIKRISSEVYKTI
ncbi:MAG TPA: hypothetical protein GX747_04440 [Tenericutes bacterium]|nr:hypothetical protein [Mycoplasmatota bacterium]